MRAIIEKNGGKETSWRIKLMWRRISRLFNVDTYEGWQKNGLAFLVCFGLTFYGLTIGLVFLILKLTGNL
jgi:hypothetical protein